ncbi:porin [Melaminivora sp.]|uniref:porin n=1 Tax=Melaminivora sp. TaxID=1933032 RepID=UPI0028AFD907|nr:porin [Melaminivora sp.]
MRPLVKKTAALAALAVTAPLLHAQTGGSSVQLYGIVDVAVRHTNHEGPAADRSVTRMVGGGMSQSRWGINVTEDLGSGLKAIANLENRIDADSGSVSTPFFQQSWVGLQSSSFGRITMGRQFNVLFDVVTSTYASFPYSPYMDAYKPEIGMSLGARASNMIKYTAEFGALRGALQYSFDEGNTVDRMGAAASGAGAVKTAGGYLRYGAGPFAAGGGYQRSTLPGGTRVDAWTLGGSYRSGPIYVNAGYAENKRKDAFVMGTAGVIDSALLSNYWSGSSNGGFMPGDNTNPGTGGNPANMINHANKRQMYKVGFGYQVTPQMNAGLHYYHARQSGSASGAFNGKAHFLVGVVDYAFSKRTDVYAAVDHTKVNGGGGMALDSNGARNRTGFTAGLRHRF